MDNRKEPKLPKFLCFDNFGLVLFGSVRSRYTKTEHLTKKYIMPSGPKNLKKIQLKKQFHGGIVYEFLSFFDQKESFNEFFFQNGL